jgi:hypothetical protein
MAEDWSAVAAEVAAAIGEVGFAATLIKPGVYTGPDYDPTPSAPVEYLVTVIDDAIRVRDQSGALTRETVRVLTIGATGVVPAKADRVRVRGLEHEIMAVMPLAPGGVDLLYELEISG